MATTERVATGGPVWTAQLFLFSLLIPFVIPLGPLQLTPHRIVLLVLFVPFLLRLFVMGQGGKVLVADWLLLLSTVWAGFALIANHPFGDIVEGIGIHMVEFFGAYLLARIAIRSAADFRRLVRTLFLIILVLTPFAAVEAITHRPIILDLLPGNHVPAVYIGERMGMRRAQAVFGHPILFGIFVSTGLGLCWFALRPRWLRLPSAVITGAATVFSLSTGALISYVIQSTFIGWETILRVLKRRWTLFTILVIVAYIGIDLLSNRTPFHVLVTYASFSTGSAYNRILIWQFGTENVWNSPLFGIGMHDWERPSWMVASVDNFWLLLGMRYGLPSITMILVALFLILRRVSRVDLTDPEDNAARAGYLVVFGGLFVAGGTVHYWHAMMAFVMFIYGSGLWTITGGAAREVEPDSVPDEPVPRASRYTRQVRPGVPIGARVTASRPVGQARQRPVDPAPPRRKAPRGLAFQLGVGRLAHGPASGRIRGQRADRLGDVTRERVRLGDGDPYPRLIIDNPVRTATGGGNDRQTPAHGLVDNISGWLAKAGKHEDVGILVERFDLVARDQAVKGDAVADTQFPGLGLAGLDLLARARACQCHIGQFVLQMPHGADHIA